MTPALRNIIIGGGYCPESIAFFQRTTALTSRRMRAYDNMIRALVASGVWAQLDAFYVFATKDTTTALLNLKSSSFPGTANGSPTFTADVGYLGVEASTTVYIDTGFNVSTGGKHTQDSAHISAWNNTNGTADFPIIGWRETGVGSSGIFPKLTTGGTTIYRVNDPSTPSAAVTAPTDARGFFLANRSGASAQQGYYNGIDQGVVAVTSAAPASRNMFILARNNDGAAQGAGQQVSSASIGGSLSAAQASAFSQAVRKYMQTIAGFIY
jgi:hypothetical protein